jgi:DNA repair exonuclease SbcCD ATPase subunit
VKIVHQAKTLRTLKLSLQREKQLAADAVKQCKAFEAANKQLDEEVDTLKLKLQRFQARAAAEKTHVMGVPTQLQRPESPLSCPGGNAGDSGALKKLCDELKAKTAALQQELKRTQRALVREVGDDVPLEDVVGNTDATASGAGRRGRAQHIIMLKAKVKKLQAQLGKMSANAASADHQAVLDVDQRAQQDISGQHVHRQKLLDQLTSQRDELQERLHRATRKYDALKARAQTLDREKQEARSKFQVLVDKSRTDDALVDALQRQLEAWKAKLHEARRARTADGANQDERAELERLRRIVAEHKSRGGERTEIPMGQQSEISQYRAVAVRCLGPFATLLL